ncbi:MAG TPA: acyltransferase [Bacteroidia bacterium]|jgi:peptidoglycan/LPS O-acetylase OafA/YrhL
MTEPQRSKIGYLEGIRGVAAFMVLLHHFQLGFYPAAFDGNMARAHMSSDWELWYFSSPLSVLTNGNFCVTIFYVLSGYVLSHKYMQTHDISSLVSAAHRRFLRLYIPIAFALVVSFLLLRFSIYHYVEASKVTKSDWWMATLVSADPSVCTLLKFLGYRVMFLGDSSFDTTMWTMPTELFGSLLVFALLALVHDTRKKYFIYCILLVYFFATQHFYYIAFVLGIMLHGVNGLAGERRNNWWRMLLVPVLFFGGLFLGSFCSLGWTHPHMWDFITSQDVFMRFDVIHILGAAMLIAAVLLSPLMQRILGSRFFVFLGFISFSLFLLHPIVIGSFSAHFILGTAEKLGYNTAAMIDLALTIILTVGLSWLMAITVDRFSMDVSKRYFVKWMKADKTGTKE